MSVDAVRRRGLHRFSPAEDAEIIEGFKSGKTLRAIAAPLGRQWTSVQQRVHILMCSGRLTWGKRSRRPWTEEQDQELRGMWGWQSPAVVARRVGRTVNAVQVRAQRLGLTDAWKGAYSSRGAGLIFAVDAKTVLIWMGHGWLKGRPSETGAGKHRRWRIEHEAIELFIRDYPMYYERRRITDSYWRELADKAAAKFNLVPLRLAAKKLGVCDETLKRRIRAGEWPAERVVCGGGWAYMVRREDLERFEYWHQPVPMVYAKGHSGAVRKA